MAGGELTPDDLAGYREQFEAGKACSHCGGLHLRACPRVRRLVFRGNEAVIAEVEFWRDGQWPTENIIWPEDVYGEEADDGGEASQAEEAG